jgi:LemA protein
VTAFLIVLGGIALLIVWTVLMYNNLVKNTNLVKEGWSGIETQLKRRANLIPNLVETVKGYATHEREAFEEVTSLRSQAFGAKGVGERSQLEGRLTAALGNLFAIAENYPELKASQNFQELQNSLSEVEDQIQLSRRYYNGTVRDLNILVESFPSNLIANAFRFRQAEFFELENAADREVPKVEFG